MKYLLFSLLTFFAGSISNFALAPWDYIFVLLFSFPLFFLVLQDIYNEKKIKNKIYLLSFLEIYFYLDISFLVFYGLAQPLTIEKDLLS